MNRIILTYLKNAKRTVHMNVCTLYIYCTYIQEIGIACGVFIGNYFRFHTMTGITGNRNVQ